MPSNLEKNAMRLYDLAWRAAMPMLSRNRRLSEGLEQRKLKIRHEKADIWIQAASAGESYLARNILESLRPPRPVKILVTSNTRQGVDILDGASGGKPSEKSVLKVSTAYFPFDAPSIMKRAAAAVDPSIMVLLESEIWPGLLSALDKTKCKILIINGRINQKSLNRYKIWPSVWKSLAPYRVLAVSVEDWMRFSDLFGPEIVRIAPNIKFDRIGSAAGGEGPVGEIGRYIPMDAGFVVLASVRKEEEPFIEAMIKEVLRKAPDATIGLFPRHMDRLPRWAEKLDRMGLKWIKRSSLGCPVSGGEVVLWDVFGELKAAYYQAKAVFVGGSLAPLGGQNFLEPLTCGIVPVMGPSWFNFYWVGDEIIKTGLVRKAKDWREASAALLESLGNPPQRDRVRKAALSFIRKRRGGTDLACRLIENLL